MKKSINNKNKNKKMEVFQIIKTLNIKKKQINIIIIHLLKIHLKFLTKVQLVIVIKIMNMAVLNFVYSVKKINDH